MPEVKTHSLGFYERNGDLELGRGNVISTGDLTDWPGSYPVYSSSAVGEGVFGQYGRHMFDEELITWSIDGGGRPFHRRRHKFSVTNVCGFLRIKRTDRWDYGYLHAVLEKLHSGMQFDYQMKAHPSVIRDLFRFACIPIDEQRGIARVRDTLDTTIRQTGAIIDKLKQVKQGLLHDLLTRGIADNGELRLPQSEAPHLYKESALGWIPTSWRIDALGANATITGGVTLGRFVSGPDTIELPYLRVANVQDGYLDLAEVKSIRVLSREVTRYSLEPGDVLMNEGGDFDKLGRGVVWAGQITQCLHQNHVFRVRCANNLLDAEYLASYSASAFGKQFFVQSSKQTTNLASINSTQLKGFPLRLPPLGEQRGIVRLIAGLDTRLQTEVASVGKSQVLKSGLMDDLLTGRVRVTPLLAGASP